MESTRPTTSRNSPRHHNNKGKSAVPLDDSSDEDDLRLLQKYMDPLPIEEAESSRPVNTGFKVSFSNLPPSMGEEDFIQHFGPLPAHNHFFYKPPLRIGMVPRNCSAVINFLDKNELADWFEKFHGYMLTDERGEEYVIEGDIMINQDLPKIPVVERDELEGTLEDTEEFQEFQDHYEDTDGVFKDPPIPAEVMQEIMLKEIEERKSKADDLQDTPLVLFFRERNKGEREKARIREEKEVAFRAAREKRRQDRKERRDLEKKERREKERTERAAKEKLRKEAARRAKRAKQKKLASERDDGPTPPAKEGEGCEGQAEVNPDAAPGQLPSTSSRPAGEEVKEGQAAKKEVPSTSGGGWGNGKERDRGGYEWRRNNGGKSGRNSSKPWDRDRETTWSKRSNKWDLEDKEKGGNWRKDAKSSSARPEGDASSAQAHNDTASSSTAPAPGEAKGEERREPKKKIVKKIIKVKKVRSSDGASEEGGGAGPSSSTAKVKVPLAPDASGGVTAGPSTSDAPKQGEAKRKPNRPDREVYRPGAWRRNSGAGGENRKPGSGGQQQGQKEGSSGDKPKANPPGGGES